MLMQVVYIRIVIIVLYRVKEIQIEKGVVLEAGGMVVASVMLLYNCTGTNISCVRIISLCFLHTPVFSKGYIAIKKYKMQVMCFIIKQLIRPLLVFLYTSVNTEVIAF
jgi:hypothetical protein